MNLLLHFVSNNNFFNQGIEYKKFSDWFFGHLFEFNFPESMHQHQIVIIMEGDIFSFGLWVQFKSWGFSKVEILKDFEPAWMTLHEQLPALVIIHEKIYNKANELQGAKLENYLPGIPIIFFSATPLQTSKLKQSFPDESKYQILNYPCTETELKAVVEEILSVLIPAA